MYFGTHYIFYLQKIEDFEFPDQNDGQKEETKQEAQEFGVGFKHLKIYLSISRNLE